MVSSEYRVYAVLRPPEGGNPKVARVSPPKRRPSGDARPTRRSLTQPARPAILKAVWRDPIGEKQTIPPVTVTREQSGAMEIIAATCLDAEQEVRTDV